MVRLRDGNLRIPKSVPLVLLILSPLLPPVFATNDSALLRWTWVCIYLGFVAFVTFLVRGLKLAAPPRTTVVSGAPYLASFIAVLFFSATICSIFFVGNSDASGLVVEFADSLSTLAGYFFPWINRFEQNFASYEAAGYGQYDKVKAVLSVWFFFGLTLTSLLLLLWFFRPEVFSSAEAARLKKGPKNRIGQLFVVLFGIYVVLSSYFGWLELDQDQSGKCLINVTCFMKSDLMIVLAGALKAFSIFGFGLGTLLLVREYWTE